MSLNLYIVLYTLFCLYSRACYARPLGVQLSSKKNETDNVVKITVLQNAQPAAYPLSEKLEKDSMVKENKIDNGKQLDTKAIAKEMKRKRLTTENAHDRLQAGESDKERSREEQGGFDLQDYAKPKTHPPVHN